MLSNLGDPTVFCGKTSHLCQPASKETKMITLQTRQQVLDLLYAITSAFHSSLGFGAFTLQRARKENTPQHMDRQESQANFARLLLCIYSLVKSSLMQEDISLQFHFHCTLLSPPRIFTSLTLRCARVFAFRPNSPCIKAKPTNHEY